MNKLQLDKFFNDLLDEIKQNVNEDPYILWFSKLEPISLNDNKLIIKVPMMVHKNRLSIEPFKSLIENSIYTITGNKYEVEYLTEDELKEQEDEDKNIETNSQQEIFNDIEINDDWDSNLNPNLNFDNFVVGDSNRFAVSAAHMVAENPGNVHNPLFLYGKSGIGKTHLMHAIGNYIVQNSNKKVLYVTSNDFKSEYAEIASLNKGIDSINYAKEFKHKYQNVDVLIIDDIQFLVGADKTQTEFFHTFNELTKQNKQIIISSDRSPDDLKKIEDRLRSRFMMGLSVDIFPPDFSLRCKIIQRKVKNTLLEDKLSPEIVEYIANSCQNDVRFIEGTINRLMAYTAMMTPKKIDLEFTIEALKDYLSVNIYAENSIGNIQKAVADYFNITVNDLKSKKKTNNIAKPRHIAIYLCRMEADEGLARIGLEFGGRDHSTISASILKIENELKTDTKLAEVVKEIKNKL